MNSFSLSYKNIAMHELESLRYSAKGQMKKNESESISIGDFSYGTFIVYAQEHGKLQIGKFCSFANDLKIFLGSNHRTDWVTTYPFNTLIPSYSYIKGSPSTNGDIIIGNDVWIGSDVKIMSGVSIGNGAVIGANALVTKNVEPYAIYGGVPAKKIKLRFDKSIIDFLQKIAWWDWELCDLVDAIPLLQSNSFDELQVFYETKIATSTKKQFLYDENFWTSLLASVEIDSRVYARSKLKQPWLQLMIKDIPDYIYYEIFHAKDNLMLALDCKKVDDEDVIMRVRKVFEIFVKEYKYEFLETETILRISKDIPIAEIGYELYSLISRTINAMYKVFILKKTAQKDTV